MSESRKLAAILATDVVGYSRLAGTDEDRTLARLRALRSDLIDPTVAVHNGRVVKRTGDGTLIEFRSVVDAVRCAIEVQSGMIERNAGLPPERRIEFRVGIHLGDVVEESDGDLMGDGVNIAARLEGIAKPGAICLSEDAYRQVKARLDLAVIDLGPTQLKNIAEPVRVYSLEVGVPAEATNFFFDLFPFDAEWRIGQHVIQFFVRVTVLRQCVASNNVGDILPLDQHVGFADCIGLVVQLLPKHGETSLRVQLR
jgi:adenylate cyclase